MFLSRRPTNRVFTFTHCTVYHNMPHDSKSRNFVLISSEIAGAGLMTTAIFVRMDTSQRKEFSLRFD